MIRLTTLLSAMALSVSIAYAEPSSNVAFDVETVRLLKNASAERGQALVGELPRAARCSSCHGADGISNDPYYTNIAGMMPSYIYKQLRDYQDEKRGLETEEGPDMIEAVLDLTYEQMADLSAFYGSLPPPAAGPKKTMSPELFQLVYRGDPERLLKSCASCHGRNGDGGMFDSPRINSQYKDFFAISMHEFKDGLRHNDVYSRMRVVAEVLTDEEIDMLAEYYAIPE